jgi:uncharacterized protein (TIGR02217 family)
MSLAVFPALTGLEYPVVRTPIFRTLTQETASGMETRAALMLYPRWRWTLSFNFLRDDANDEFRTLLGFFLARQGSFDAFAFEDTDDNAVTAQPLGQGDGTNRSFQLVRSLGGYTEPLLAPKGGATDVVVKVGGVALTASDWSYSTATPGMVVLNAAPGHGVGVTADINYYWPVRFLADQYDFAKFMNRLWEQKKLDFISVKNF